MNRLRQARLKFKGARRKAIDFILRFPEISGFLSIDELAGKIGISASSLSRTASDIGYSGFPEMQKDVQEFLRQKLLPTARMERAVPEKAKYSFRDSIKNDMYHLEKVIADISDNAFNMSVDIISEAREVFVVGLGTQFPSATYFSGVMRQIREHVTLISHESTDYIHCFSRFSPQDVLVSICLPRYSRFTVRAAQEGVKRGCRIVAVTDNELSPTGRLAEVVLQAGYESMSFFNSNVAVMAILNAIATSVALKHRDVSRERVRELSALAESWDVFFSDDFKESTGDDTQ